MNLKNKDLLAHNTGSAYWQNMFETDDYNAEYKAATIDVLVLESHAAQMIHKKTCVTCTPLSTGFGANSNQGQIVTNIGYYLGLLVTNLNDNLIILHRPNQ